MVDPTDGQFYTMEGIAAAVLMVLTAYLVMGATSVYTPGDTHIIDMQLEQVGNDALKMLDTKNLSSNNLTDLELYVWTHNTTAFDSSLNSLLNSNLGDANPIKYKADIYYIIGNTGNVSVYEFLPSTHYTGDVNGVRISRWVFVPPLVSAVPYNKTRNQTVLLEVLLWRD
jgi:hypothetical protein